MRAFLRHVALLGAIALMAGGCRSSAPTGLVIHGASSLTEALTAVAAAWARSGQPHPTLSFAATSRLARQIREGAPGDVLVSADEAWMDVLERDGKLRPGTRRPLLRNRMVVVVPTDDSSPPRSLEDLGHSSIERIGVAGENVPAGRYTDAVLEAAGASGPFRDKIVRGESVRTVLTWVAGHEVDAGFVYATDARIDDDVRVAFVVPERLQPPIVYPIAVLSTARDPEAAARFVEFCAGPEGRSIFEAAGFRVVTERAP